MTFQPNKLLDMWEENTAEQAAFLASLERSEGKEYAARVKAVANLTNSISSASMMACARFPDFVKGAVYLTVDNDLHELVKLMFVGKDDAFYAKFEKFVASLVRIHEYRKQAMAKLVGKAHGETGE